MAAIYAANAVSLSIAAYFVKIGVFVGAAVQFEDAPLPCFVFRAGTDVRGHLY